MEENYRRKTFWEFVAPKVAAWVVVPTGLLAGAMIGLMSDFGVTNTLRNIKLNPEVFTAQYAWVLVVGGWAAIAALLAAAVVCGAALIRVRG